MNWKFCDTLAYFQSNKVFVASLDNKIFLSHTMKSQGWLQQFWIYLPYCGKETLFSFDEMTKNSTAAVCEFCYRSFESLTIAEIHESTCDRNPDSTAIADPYHLSSVYRDIRPPAPMIIGAPDTKCKKDRNDLCKKEMWMNIITVYNDYHFC